MWLDDNNNSNNTVMNEVKQKVEKWREKKFKMDNLEQQFLAAKADYEAFVHSSFVLTLRQNGLESLGLEDGSTIEVVQQTRCSLKKDEESKKEVAAWLPDYLSSRTLIVPASFSTILKEHSVPFDEDIKMNTNSVKAWILGEMRMGNVKAEDLPKGISWFQWDDVVVK
jgi:hypothetical protein